MFPLVSLSGGVSGLLAASGAPGIFGGRQAAWTQGCWTTHCRQRNPKYRAEKSARPFLKNKKCINRDKAQIVPKNLLFKEYSQNATESHSEKKSYENYIFKITKSAFIFNFRLFVPKLCFKRVEIVIQKQVISAFYRSKSVGRNIS